MLAKPPPAPHRSPERARPDPRRAIPPIRSQAQALPATPKRQHSTPLSSSRRVSASASGLPALPPLLPPSPRAIQSGPSTPKPRSPDKAGIPGWAEDVLPTSLPPPSTAHAPSQSTHRAGHAEKYVIDGIERESWEVITQDPAGEEVSQKGIDAAARLDHARQITHYKNLLVRAQSASSASIHELHTQLHSLESRYKALQEEHAQCTARKAEEARAASVEKKASRILAEGKGVREVVRASTREERIDLLGFIAGACHPSDIDAQIRLLEKYKRSRLDILGRLPDHLAAKVLLCLDLPEVLGLRLVCKRYAEIVRSPIYWQQLCRQLEWRDWDGEAGLAHLAKVADHEWEALYRRLWKRERNWSTGQAQSVMALSGHSNYVTSLKLRGDTLISGSYDETIRLWTIPALSKDKPSASVVLPAKAVSCLDYYPPDEVFVAGTHDIGRVQVWKKDTAGTWNVLHTLAGHLHGIRAVAINDKWLVSAGADKALVVWDWRTGEKVVRFGQQTNICVGIQLVHDHLIAITVDGVIRTFSIKKRDMVSQYKLSDLHQGKADLKGKLKNVGGGVGGVGMINWFEGQGRDMICATREMIVRLEWEETVEEWTTEPVKPVVAPPHVLSPRIRTASTVSHVVSAPVTPTKAPLIGRKRTTPAPLRQPLISPPQSNSARAPAMARSKSQDSRASPVPTTPKMQRHISSTLASPSPTVSTASRKAPTRRTSMLPSSLPGLTIPETTSIERGTRTIPLFSRPPTIKEVLHAPDIERGAVDARRTRIVSSTRFAARAGADRQLYVTAPAADGRTAMIPITGAWRDQAARLELQTPEKNPMSVVMDREKSVYGCTDGTIVVVGFV